MTIKGFLRLLFGVMAALTMAALGQSAWSSWQDLSTAQRSKVAAHASAAIFNTMVNLRLEGSLTKGMLDRPEPATPLSFWAPAREAQVKGMIDAIAALGSADIADRDRTVATLQRQLTTLQALHKDTAAAILRPKAERPADLSQKYTDFSAELRKLLSDIGPVLQASVLLKDPLVDQWLALHNLAWAMRSASGDAMTNITNNLTVIGKIPEDAPLHQAAMLERVDFIWATLNDRLKGLPQSAEVAQAVAEARQTYFDPSFRPQQLAYLKQLMAGQKPDMAWDQWDRLTIPKTRSLANVAVALINAASHAADAKAETAQGSLELALALLVGSLAFTLAVFFAIGWRITGPLHSLTSTMRSVADGALDTEIVGVGRRDEIGEMAGTLAVFRDGLRRNRELEQESAHGREASERERKAMLADLATRFEAVVVGIVSSVFSSAGELESAATTLRGATDETSHRSNNVAAAAEQASSNVANVASAAEELGASVQEIGRQIASSAEMSEAAVKEARSTAVVVGELSDAAHRISDVLGLISNIAGQTNLLALNATIEAARAGEAGRGFAVVAAEVKGLADQTAKATADISLQINAIQGSTGRAVEAIGGIAERIEGMNRVTLEVSESIRAQNAATGEIVHSIAQASAGASEVTGNIAGVAQAALHSGAIVKQVLSASTTLAGQASQMRGEVDRFLKTVRAA